MEVEIPEVNIQLVNSMCRPYKAHNTDAGYDVFSRLDTRLYPESTEQIPLGFFMALPGGWEAQIRPRSGLAAKSGITILNTPGTIDSGFRGEIAALLHNTSDDSFFVQEGDKIAQMVIKRVPEVKLVEVDWLTDSERGSGGFGSTGK